jgi:hypothetical protein
MSRRLDWKEVRESLKPHGSKGGCRSSRKQLKSLLMQLRVLSFGLLQEGDVGVGVFPYGLKREH